MARPRLPCPNCGKVTRMNLAGDPHCRYCFDEHGKSHRELCRNSPRERLRRSFYQAKIRSAQTGLVFTIELKNLTLSETCPVLGIPLTNPSIDRRNNSKGYTPENVRVISWRANRLKSDATLEELKKLVAYMTD